MARPPLPIGTAGEIKAVEIGPKLWRAQCWFRDFDGERRRVKRNGRSETAAKNALRAALRDRLPTTGSDITADTRLREVVAKFLDQVKRECEAGGKSWGTHRLYRSQCKNYILPGMGELLVRECTVPRCNALFVALRERQGDQAVGADVLRTTRSVLSGVLGLAIRHGALAGSNPVREIEVIPGAERTSRALTPDERADWLSKLDADEWAVSMDLPDITRFLLSTGVRIGEALAVLWADVDLDAATVTIDHHVIRVDGVGLVRTKGTKGKSRAGMRKLPLPKWAVRMLRRRRPEVVGELMLVFPSPFNGGLRDPSEAGKKYRKARDAAGYDWVSSHTMRHTVATILDEAGMTERQIADHLGHESVATTRAYIGRKTPAGAASAAAALEDAAPVKLRPVSGE